MKKEKSTEKEIITIKSLALSRRGFIVEFSIPVNEIFEPIPGTSVKGRRMSVPNYWNWRQYLKLCLKYYGKPNANHDYFFESTNQWSTSGGYERVKYSIEKRAKSPYLSNLGNKIGGVTKLDKLDSIPTSVSFSQK
jgi:hypothetical protein